jgi:hypothetical protein
MTDSFESVRERLAEAAVKDPLSEVTRKERRVLLGFSIICYALVKAELVPTRISAFGIDFSEANQRALLHVLALVVGYLLIAFAVYAASDFVAWRIAFYAAYREFGSTPIPSEVAGAPKLPGLSELRRGVYRFKNPTSELAHGLSFPVSFLRGLFEFLVPLGFGGYVLYLLLTTKL